MNAYGPAVSPPPAGPDEALARWRGLVPGAGPRYVLLEGFHALKHALRFGAAVPVALCTDRAGALELAAELAPELGGVLARLLVEVDAEALRGLVPRPHPTGVAALAERPDPAAVAAALRGGGRRTPVVVLDQPRHLGNAGAVVRLAAGFEVTGVVTTGPLDPWHPTVVRGGAGLHFATAVAPLEVPELPGGPLFALDPEGADIRDTVLPDDALLAFGSERHGLSAALRARADHLVALPMRPQVSSYNLATSVGMALFHWASASGAAPGAGPGARSV